MAWMKISKKKLIDALKNMVLFSALFHMTLLIIYAIATGNINVLNYFDVLDLEFYWPPIVGGWESNIASLFAAILVTVFFYIRSKD